MLKNILFALVALLSLAQCSSDGVDPGKNRNPNPSKPIDGSGNNPGTTPSNLSDVVDDPSLVSFLSGKWGYYSRGTGKKYSTHQFEFSERSTKFVYTWSYNSYETLYDIQIVKNEYQMQIRKDTLYAPDPITGKLKKFARLEKVSGDEMKLYQISETSNSYKEFLPYELTKINEAEFKASDVILNTSLLPMITGKWIAGSTEFDFSSGKNHLQFTSTLGSSKSIEKQEFKVSEEGRFFYRKWADDFDPAWKTYFFQLEGGNLVVYDKKGGVVKYKLSR